MPNWSTLIEFVSKAEANRKSKGRIIFYLNRVKVILTHTDKDIVDWTKEDVEKIVKSLRKSDKDYSDWSMYSFQVALKKIGQISKGHDWNSKEYPESVSWIRANKEDKKRLPDTILSKADVEQMAEAMSRKRDRAVIMFLYESGCRIGEMLNMRVRDVTFNEHGARVRLSGKTGDREIPIVFSVPFISQWISTHPNKEDQEAYLWVKHTDTDNPLNYDAVRFMLRSAARKGKVSKEVNPHAFRHSAATRDAKLLTESELCLKFGWRQGSRMPSTYVHLSGRDLDAKVYGIATAEDEKTEVKTCPICHTRNTFDAKLCQRCGNSLSFDFDKFQRNVGRLLDILQKPEARKLFGGDDT